MKFGRVTTLGVVLSGALLSFACARPLATVPPSRVEDRKVPDAEQVLPRPTEPIEATTPGNIPTPPLDEPVEGGDSERDVHPSKKEIVARNSLVLGLATLRSVGGPPSPPIHGNATLSEYASNLRLVVSLEGPPADYQIELSREPWPCARVAEAGAPLVRVGEVKHEQGGVAFVRILEPATLEPARREGSPQDDRPLVQRFEDRVVVARRLGAQPATACGPVRLERGDPAAVEGRPKKAR